MTMCWSRSRLLSFVLGSLTLAGAGRPLATAGPAEGDRPLPPPPVRPAVSPLQDLRLSLNARRALLQDRGLAPLNLSVQVRQGVATVWGPVPSEALANRALNLVRGVEGIDRVRSDLYVNPPVWTLDLPGPATTWTGSALPSTDSVSLRVLDGLARELPPAESLLIRPPAVSALPPAPVSPRELPRSVREPTHPPLVAVKQPLRPATIAKPVATLDLPREVERLRTGRAVYRAVRVEVRGQTVLVRAGGAPEEYAMALAEEIRKLPGVRAVQLEE
jgi:hypothetical protein